MPLIHFVISLLSLNSLLALDATPKRSLIRPRRLSRPPSLDRTEPPTSFSDNEQGKVGSSSALTSDATKIKSTRVSKSLSSTGIKTSNIPIPKDRPTTIIAPSITKKSTKKFDAEDEDDDFSVVDTMEDSDDYEDEEDEVANNVNDDEDFDSIESFIGSIDDSGLSYVSKKYKKGDKIVGTITRFGRLGMSIETKPDHTTGLILQQEVDFLKQSSNGGFDPQIGDTVSGYVQFVREDGKLDVCLRPVGFDRLQSARESILAALQASPTKSLDVGDKSSPEMVMSRLPGMSKNMYKTGISALLRDGIIDISEFEMKLIPEKDRDPLISLPYTGKTPRGFKPTDATTLFISNFPYSTSEVELAECIEEEMGYGKLAKIKMSLDRVTGRPAGYAYVNFFTPDQAIEALKVLNNRVEVEGRKLRVMANAKSSSSLKTEFKSSNSKSASNSATTSASASSRAAEGSSYSNREAYSSRQSSNTNEGTSSRSSPSIAQSSGSRGSSRSINDSDDDILGDFDFDSGGSDENTNKNTDNKKTRKSYSDEGEDDNDDEEEIVNTKGKWRQTASESPYGRKTERVSATERVLQTREGRNAIVDSYKSKYSASATPASTTDRRNYNNDNNDSRQQQGERSWQRSSSSPSSSRDRDNNNNNNNDRNYGDRKNNNRDNSRGGDNSSRGSKTYDRDNSRTRNNEGRGRNFDTRSASSSVSGGSGAGGDDQYSVFVGGLPYSATESLVKQSLESALPSARGLINEIRLVRQGGTGESRGYGYVDFANLDTAKQAVAELSGRMILGRTLKLDIEGPKRRPKNY